MYVFALLYACVCVCLGLCLLVCVAEARHDPCSLGNKPFEIIFFFPYMYHVHGASSYIIVI